MPNQSNQQQNLLPESSDFQTPEATSISTVSSEQLSTGSPAQITIPLLEERLLVKREKRKVGEVIIKKEVETRIVETPIRREVIIVEQVGSPNIQLAEIDLANRDNWDSETDPTTKSTSEYVIRGEFTSAKIASEILQEIAIQAKNEITKISIEITVENQHQQMQFQQIIDRTITT